MSNKAFTEVNEIIAHMPDEYVKKIPANFMKMIIENMDCDYHFNYDVSKDYKDQDISDEAHQIMTLLYIRYWSNGESIEDILK
jgi:hypothetical protein